MSNTMLILILSVCSLRVLNADAFPLVPKPEEISASTSLPLSIEFISQSIQKFLLKISTFWDYYAVYSISPMSIIYSG